MESTKTPPEQAEIRRLANAIRGLTMDAVQAAKSGHPGLPMGMADAAAVLFSRFLKFDPADPQWPDRDRFVLSGGHGSMLLYSLLYLLGYAGPTLDFDVQPLVRPEEVPGSRLSPDPDEGPYLGWNTWMPGPVRPCPAGSVACQAEPSAEVHTTTF